MNLATGVQNVFTAAKLVAILIIICGGAYKLIEGKHEATSAFKLPHLLIRYYDMDLRLCFHLILGVPFKYTTLNHSMKKIPSSETATFSTN